jgi:hypothetical protein
VSATIRLPSLRLFATPFVERLGEVPLPATCWTPDLRPSAKTECRPVRGRAYSVEQMAEHADGEKEGTCFICPHP